MYKEIKRHSLNTIGKAASEWRRETGIRQSDIAADIGTSIPNISRFERGTNDSATILLWYILHGFDPLESAEIWQLLKN